MSAFKKYRTPLSSLEPDLHVKVRTAAKNKCNHMPLSFCAFCLIDVLIDFLVDAESEKYVLTQKLKSLEDSLKDGIIEDTEVDPDTH